MFDVKLTLHAILINTRIVFLDISKRNFAHQIRMVVEGINSIFRMEKVKIVMRLNQ